MLLGFRVFLYIVLTYNYHANINIVETVVVWHKMLTTERVHQATSDAKQETFKSECFAAMETFINGAIQASQINSKKFKS